MCSQCIAIYGEESFKKLHRFLYEARSNGTDEATIIVGLKKIVNNTRDCFLIDQLIFLEKQQSPWKKSVTMFTASLTTTTFFLYILIILFLSENYCCFNLQHACI